jgi:hypothetical protein
MRFYFDALLQCFTVTNGKYISYIYKTKTMKFNKETALGALLVLIVIMVLKPNLLGFLYNNILGKLIFVAAIVFITLKHSAAGLLAVVFVAIIATMSGYNGFEGMEDKDKDAANEDAPGPCAEGKGPCKDGKCKDGKTKCADADAAAPASAAAAAADPAKLLAAITTPSS